MLPSCEAAAAAPALFAVRLLQVGNTTFPVVSFPVAYGPFGVGDWATLAGCQPSLSFTNLQKWLTKGVFRECGDPLSVPVAMMKTLHPSLSNVCGSTCYAFSPAALSAALVRKDQFKHCAQLPFTSPTYFPVLSELPTPRVLGTQVRRVHCLWDCLSFCMLLQCTTRHAYLTRFANAGKGYVVQGQMPCVDCKCRTHDCSL